MIHDRDRCRDEKKEKPGGKGGEKRKGEGKERKEPSKVEFRRKEKFRVQREITVNSVNYCRIYLTYYVNSDPLFVFSAYSLLIIIVIQFHYLMVSSFSPSRASLMGFPCHLTPGPDPCSPGDIITRTQPSRWGTLKYTIFPH